MNTDLRLVIIFNEEFHCVATPAGETGPGVVVLSQDCVGSVTPPPPRLPPPDMTILG